MKEKTVAKVIKVLANIYAIGGFLGSVIGGIVMMTGGDIMVLMGFIVILGGALISLTISCLLQGAAILIENSRVKNDCGSVATKKESVNVSSFDTPYDNN